MGLPSRGMLFVCLSACLLTSAPALAQNWSFDARRIGIGGVGSTSNVALEIVDEQRPYRAIVLPFGLFQILPNMPKLDPTKDEFDLVRAIEYSRQSDSLHHRARRYEHRVGVHHRSPQRRAQPGSERLPRLLARHQLVRRGTRVTELGLYLQVQEERQRIVSRHLRGRRDLLLDEHGGGNRSRAGGCIREPDAGLRPEHQLLHDERHGEPVRHGHHRRVSRPLRLGRRRHGRQRQRRRRQSGPRRSLHRRECALSQRVQLRALSARTPGSTPTPRGF